MEIAVILVTYNRLKLLKHALECYDNQSYKMKHLLIIDNASTDGTSEYLDEWKEEKRDYNRIVVHNSANVGGSGGFYLGLKESLKLDYDFAFLADDDAFADEKMLEHINNFYDRFDEKDAISGLCTAVINKGQIDCMHRRSIKKNILTIDNIWISKDEYQKEYFDVDEFSFVGALIKKRVIEKIGLPCKEYFIYYDDTEYSARVRSAGRIICVPSSKMYHDSEVSSDTTWRDYYVLRNSADNIKKHYPKRYYRIYLTEQYLKKCTFLGVLAKNRSKAQIKMFKKAIHDTQNDILGKSDIYYPGVDIEKV